MKCDRVTAISYPDDTVESYDYDAASNTTTYHYDSMGRVCRVTNAAGRTKEFTYDAIGNLIKATDYAGNSISYAYGTVGRISEITSAAGTSIYEYDLLDRPVRAIVADIIAALLGK